VLQRKPAGLREPTPISGYAKEALDYWKEPGNAKKTLQDFASHLFAKANDALKALNVWPMLKKFDSTQQTPGEARERRRRRRPQDHAPPGRVAALVRAGRHTTRRGCSTPVRGSRGSSARPQAPPERASGAS
jgi:hypothetical protein